MFTKKLLHTTEVAKIFYYNELKTFEIVWYNNVLLDNNIYKEPFCDIVELSLTYEIKNLISDVRNQGVVPPSEKNWLKYSLLPLINNFKLEKIAILNNSNIVKNYYINAISKLISSYEVNFKVFNNNNKALTWIYKN